MLAQLVHSRDEMGVAGVTVHDSAPDDRLLLDGYSESVAGAVERVRRGVELITLAVPPLERPVV